MQIHPLFLEVLTRERELDVERRRRSALARRRRRAGHADSVSIRLARPSDSAAVGRVVNLDAGTAEGVRVAALVDSGERPGVLLAEVDGSPIAALDLSGGEELAYGDPFRRSAAAITQLRARARQLGAGPRGRVRRLRSTLSRPEPRHV